MKTNQQKRENYNQKMCGKIPYGFTNDYMFRAVFQKNERALKGLLSAVLGIPREEIISCEITNPIILGNAIDDKTCILDIRLLLNYGKKVNLEMQIGNIGNWPKRSLYYTCNMYVDLHSGEDYTNTLPCIHIGFINSSPFSDYHEFFSKYQLINSENGHVYSGDFTLIMIQLDQLECVSEETKKSDIYRWTKLFMATEWEEVLKMAEESEELKEAVVTLRNLTEDEQVKLQCMARQRYEADRKSIFMSGEEKGRKEGRLEGIRALILDNLEEKKTEEQIVEKLMKRFTLSQKEAEELLCKYAE
ncbi:MAG: Rpn family recombination-promoting nuclease/putative transposase [Eubacteriales bacterium]|nr:Rpn family recombination-promoting nuclease/putative transposase [Eubacteriales bacterium]